MKLKKIVNVVPLAVLLLAGALYGCSSGGGDVGGAKDEKAPEKTPDPVTLSFYQKSVLSNEDFEKYINQFVKKKFPHVTLQFQPNVDGRKIEDLIISGDIPDIIYDGVTNLHTLTPLDIPADMTALVKKYEHDLNVYEPMLVETIKSYSDKSELLHLPFTLNAFALHYNKDIFDQFGVAYPEDGMSWDDVIEVGRKLTRNEGGISYVGLRPPLAFNRLQSQAALPYATAAGKAMLATDGWKSLLELVKRIDENTGMPPIKSLWASRNEFRVTKTVAMLPDIMMTDSEREDGLNWDYVTYPTFKDKPNISVGMWPSGFVLPKGSDNNDLAFQIIFYLSTDPEVQLEATRNGRLTVLKDMEIKKQAFANNPAIQKKNIEKLMMQSYPTPPQATIYDLEGMNIVQKVMIDYLAGIIDVNNALKQAEEQLDKKIADLKAR